MENFKDISLNESAKIESGENAKQVFCNGWPVAKVTLTSIKAMVKNPIVKIMITAVIACGDAIQEKFC